MVMLPVLVSKTCDFSSNTGMIQPDIKIAGNKKALKQCSRLYIQTC